MSFYFCLVGYRYEAREGERERRGEYYAHVCVGWMTFVGDYVYARPFVFIRSARRGVVEKKFSTRLRQREEKNV